MIVTPGTECWEVTKCYLSRSINNFQFITASGLLQNHNSVTQRSFASKNSDPCDVSDISFQATEK